MKKIIKIKIITGMIVALLLGLLILLDVLAISDNPTDYIRVCEISDSSPHWMFKSVTNYVIWSLGQVAICLTYIALSLIVLIKKQSNVLMKSLIIFEIIVLIWFIRYYYLFYASGFDHYPGFDPYIF
mgnify:CR=1 FL=1